MPRISSTDTRSGCAVARARRSQSTGIEAVGAAFRTPLPLLTCLRYPLVAAMTRHYPKLLIHEHSFGYGRNRMLFWRRDAAFGDATINRSVLSVDRSLL